jgi:hypothetical protein
MDYIVFKEAMPGPYYKGGLWKPKAAGKYK